MKKLLSVILVVTMLFVVMAPCASATNERTPIIYIRGNGEKLYYPDGTQVVAAIEDLSLGGEDDGIGKDKIVETAVNILKPFILEGMLFDKWDNYGKALYEELSPLFKGAGLDYDGNSIDGIAIGKERQKLKEAFPYSAWEFNNNHDYHYIYDWRLSPYDLVDDLHAFIKQIMKTNNTSQVSIYARCIGGGLLSAYIDKYGHEGHIKNVLFSDVLSNESTLISKAFSGQIEFDAKLVERYAGQLDFLGQVGDGIGFAFGDLLYEIVFKSMSFFNQIGATDAALDGVEELYEKLYKALVPAMCHATGFATQVNYWSCVSDEDMDEALDLIFGKEGTETRTKYAGLIEKIELYRTNILSDLEGFYKRAKANGIHMGFVSKYGLLNAPMTVDADLLSDSLVSVKHSTMGATCAKIGETLSEDYIAARVAEGNGKYISPDKKIDLSTAFSPDTTWVYKNAHHSVNYAIDPVIREFLNGTNETVDTVKAGTQFQMYDYDTDTAYPMTEDNCADYEWMNKPVEEPTKESIFVAAMRWFTMLFKIIGMLLKGEISFGEAKEMI